jgi:hypothetical protein
MWSEGETNLPREVLNDGRCSFTQDQACACRCEEARITTELDAGRRWWDDQRATWRPDVA